MAVTSVCLLGAFCGLPVAEAGPKETSWPQFRGPHRDGLSEETGLLKEWPSDGPPLLWKTPGLGIGFSSVSLKDGRIFTMGDRDGSSHVAAINAKDGQIAWTAKVGKAGGSYAGTRSTPTIDADRVYALGQFGDLVCLNAASGKELWRHNLPKDFKGASGGWNYCESVLVDGDKLICTPGGPEATLVAFNKKNGEVLWKCPIPGGEAAGYASMVISEASGVRQYVQLLSNSLVGVRASDGKLLWRYGEAGNRFGGNTANVPNAIVDGNLVFASAGYGRGGGLIELSKSGDTFQVKELYFEHELNNRHGGIVHVGPNIYADRDHGGRLFCADFKTGKVQWHNGGKTQGSGSAAVTYADGHLYVRYDNGYVALVDADAKGYKERGSFKIPNSDHDSWNHPVVIGGRLYLREKDTLWCYDVHQH
jgi:outer membrane protein assembly factor BamB